MAPPNNKSFSVSVVLPASGWEIMAKVRRWDTSRNNSGEKKEGSVMAYSVSKAQTVMRLPKTKPPTKRWRAAYKRVMIPKNSLAWIFTLAGKYF